MTAAWPWVVVVVLAVLVGLTALALWVIRGQRPAAFTLGCVAVAIAGVVDHGLFLDFAPTVVVGGAAGVRVISGG